MELNAEQIKKALECCSADTSDCHHCPYSEFQEGNCFDNAKKDAVSLIKELTKLYEALEAIIWYDGHYDWLKELCGELETAKKEGENYPNPLPIEAWHTEQHTIWMILVGMFGDWGTSIRGGWIEKHDECIAFIEKINKRDVEGG